ncbi:MAG: hypothetical protein AAF745_04295, partial [Planctomycetota bacterium]
ADASIDEDDATSMMTSIARHFVAEGCLSPLDDHLCKLPNKTNIEQFDIPASNRMLLIALDEESSTRLFISHQLLHWGARICSPNQWPHRVMRVAAMYGFGQKDDAKAELIRFLSDRKIGPIALSTVAFFMSQVNSTLEETIASEARRRLNPQATQRDLEALLSGPGGAYLMKQWDAYFALSPKQKRFINDQFGLKDVFQNENDLIGPVMKLTAKTLNAIKTR